jgi:hypothetical protein
LDLNNHVFSNFAFHHMEGNKVAVRLLPDYGCEASRNAMWQLGILLTPSEQLKASFKAADHGKNGFLMKDSARKGKETVSERQYPFEY